MLLVIFFLHDGENPLKNETLLEHITGLFSSTPWCKASTLEGKNTVPLTGPTVLLHPFHLQRLSLFGDGPCCLCTKWREELYLFCFFRVFLCLIVCIIVCLSFILWGGCGEGGGEMGIDVSWNTSLVCTQFARILHLLYFSFIQYQ